jgi:hypothetical protein
MTDFPHKIFRYEYAVCPCCEEQLSYISEEDGLVSFACMTDECPIDKVVVSGDVNRR